MTGRGAGYCAGYAVPGYMNSAGGRGFGRGVGRGFGRGRGFGWGFAAPCAAPYAAPVVAPVAGQELDILRQQAEGLTRTLGEIKVRIDELEKSGDS